MQTTLVPQKRFDPRTWFTKADNESQHIEGASIQIFDSVGRIDKVLLWIFEMVSSLAVLLLAFGLITSQTNVQTHGLVLSNNEWMQQAWAWTQNIAIDMSLLGAIIRACVYWLEKERMKALIYTLLSGLLLFTAAVVSNIEAVMQSVNGLSLEGAYGQVIFPVTVQQLTAIRSLAIVIILVAHAVQYVSWYHAKYRAKKQPFNQSIIAVKDAKIDEMTEQFTTLQNQFSALAKDVIKENDKHAQTLVLLVGQIQGLQTLLGPGKNDPKSDLTSQQTPGLTSGQKDRNTDELKEVKPAFSLPQKESKNDFLEEYKTLVKTYPNVQSWQSTGQRSVTLEEIIEATNHTRKMILNRVNDKTLKATPRNPNAYLIESVLNWLLTAPLPAVKEVHIVPETPRQNPEQNDVLEAGKTLVTV